MIKLFATLIIAKRKTIEQTKEKDREAIIAELKRRGYDKNGDKIEVLDERTNDNV